MTTPQPPAGGGLMNLMANAGVMVDGWVHICRTQNMTTPELVALMYLSSESWETKLGQFVILAASAIQRVAMYEQQHDETDDYGDPDA